MNHFSTIGMSRTCEFMAKGVSSYELILLDKDCDVGILEFNDYLVDLVRIFKAITMIQ